MKQKRKVKSLIPQKKNWSESFLVMILLALSIALCLGSASLMTASVLGATPLPNISRPFTNITYTGLDDNQEVLYDMKFVDPNNLYRVVSDIYISGASLYISPSPVIVHPLNSLGQVDRTVNVVKSGVYSHILGGRNNDVRSANITLVAGEGNIVFEDSDNYSVLGGKNNCQIYGGSAGSAPSVVAGGEDHFLGSSSDGIVFLGGNGNSVHSTATNGVFLGGKDNTISYVNNVIVGGTNIYDEMSANNIFAYSNFSSNFYPESSNAFYLNMLKGVGIGMDSDDKGLYVSGVVSVGEIDITSIDCNNSNYGVIGMFNGCIVGCTASGSSNAKRNMLDRSEHCLDVCDDYYSTSCIPGSEPVPSHPDYPAFCITGDLDLNLDRVELCYPDLLNYENIVFQADLVDDCDSDNKCMYKCKEGYSREGTGCFSDCTMDWLDADDETFKHNVAFTGYSSGSLSCGILRDDGSDSECGNFGTGLVCYDGTIYLADNGGNYIPGSSVQAQSYNYRSCGLSGFDCDSTYNLDWLAVKFDFPENFNTVALPSFNIGDILTGIAGGVYELCVDYNVYGGQCRRSGYEFVKLGCTTGYTYIPSDGSCKKDCINGLAHGETGFYYDSTGAVCDDTCNGQTLKCNNGHLSYKFKKAEGVYLDVSIPDGENWYPYTGCNLLDKTCDSSYNVSQYEFEQWSGAGVYVSCVSYTADNVNNVCNSGTVYKLDHCIDGFHDAGDHKHCISNTKPCNPPETTPNGTGILLGDSTFDYSTPPTPDYWNYVENLYDGSSLEACQFTCTGHSIWNSSSKECQCTNGRVWDDVSNECQCTHGRVWDSVSNECKCPDGMVWDPNLGEGGACKNVAGFCSTTDLWQCGGGVSPINTGYCEDGLCVWQCDGDGTAGEYAQKRGIKGGVEDWCGLCEDSTAPDVDILSNGGCDNNECCDLEWRPDNSNPVFENLEPDEYQCIYPHFREQVANTNPIQYKTVVGFTCKNGYYQDGCDCVISECNINDGLRCKNSGGSFDWETCDCTCPVGYEYDYVTKKCEVICTAEKSCPEGYELNSNGMCEVHIEFCASDNNDTIYTSCMGNEDYFGGSRPGYWPIHLTRKSGLAPSYYWTDINDNNIHIGILDVVYLPSEVSLCDSSKAYPLDDIYEMCNPVKFNNVNYDNGYIISDCFEDIDPCLSSCDAECGYSLNSCNRGVVTETDFKAYRECSNQYSSVICCVGSRDYYCRTSGGSFNDSTCTCTCPNGYSLSNLGKCVQNPICKRERDLTLSSLNIISYEEFCSLSPKDGSETIEERCESYVEGRFGSTGTLKCSYVGNPDFMTCNKDGTDIYSNATCYCIDEWDC